LIQLYIIIRNSVSNLKRFDFEQANEINFNG
jgi:hypothetical protein